MKLLVALFFGLSSAALAQNNADQRTATFSFNQANLAINLDQKDFETIYRTDEVPDTCYRDEVQGTRTSCHTEYDHDCHTDYENQCHNESYPVCNRVGHEVCNPSTECIDEPDQVCNSSGCTSILRRVCHSTQVCSTEYEDECTTASKEVCETLPKQSCQDIPREACSQVPNVVKVAYSCTREVKVPIGQALKLYTTAKIALNLVNFAEVGATPDSIIIELKNGEISFTSLNQASNQYLYQIIDQKKSEQIISATEKAVKFSVSVKATSIQKLNAFQNSSIHNPKLYLDHLEFSFEGIFNIPIQGHLKILQYRRFRSDIVVINSDFDTSILVGQNSVEKMMFNAFKVDSLIYASHAVELLFRLDMKQLKKGLINPDATSQLSTKSILHSFNAFPIQ